MDLRENQQYSITMLLHYMTKISSILHTMKELILKFYSMQNNRWNGEGIQEIKAIISCHTNCLNWFSSLLMDEVKL
jgi:hypothetical protein